MKIRFFSVLLLLTSLQTQAAVHCPAYPEAEQTKADVLKQVLTEEGFSIQTFKVDNHCYEIYGRNKQGKKVELYFDMKSLAIIAAEVEK
jgi:hypothetical protein